MIKVEGDNHMNNNITEKLLNKISNLLDLANNNPNEHEAASASLKAQELMAKYHIELADLSDEELKEDMVKLPVVVDKGNYLKWRYSLAQAIADNFRCKVFSQNISDGNMGWKPAMVFFGYESDAKIASKTFSYLFKLGNKFADRYYNKCKAEGRLTRGVANFYLQGFVKGIRDALEKQSTALMIITPKEVEDEFEEMTHSFKTYSCHISVTNDGRAYDEGRKDGRFAVESTALESK